MYVSAIREHSSVKGELPSLGGRVDGYHLVATQESQLDGEGLQVKTVPLLVHPFEEHVHAHRVVGSVAPQIKLCQRLVGAGGGHHVVRVSHDKANIDQSALGQKDDVLAIG